MYEQLIAILGFSLALIIPGYLFVLLFFAELKTLEKIAFGVGFSILFDVIIAVAFGYDEFVAARTGGINYTSLMYVEGAIVVILLAGLVYKYSEKIGKDIVDFFVWCGKLFSHRKDYKWQRSTETTLTTNDHKEDQQDIIEIDQFMNKISSKITGPFKDQADDVVDPDNNQTDRGLLDSEHGIREQVDTASATHNPELVKPLNNFKAKIKSRFNRNKAYYQFIIRSVVFVGILLSFYLFILLYFRHTSFFLNYLVIPDKFYFDFLTGLRKRDFINASLFTFIIILVWNRSILKNFKVYVQNKKQTIVFGTLAILTIVFHYFFKFMVNSNLESASDFVTIIASAKYVFNLLFIVFLAIAVYNIRILKDHKKLFVKQSPIFAGVLIAYFFIIQMFQHIWLFLGNFVARTEYFLLNLGFDRVFLKIREARTPILGVNDFIVGISEECSGIDSLLLFISLFTVLCMLDWKDINKKRFVMLFIIGLVGTVAYNILRIFLLMIVGIYISPEFAVDMFHTNVGWILFLVFFIIFWHYASKWIYNKKITT